MREILAAAWPHTEIRGARCKVPNLHTLKEAKARLTSDLRPPGEGAGGQLSLLKT